MKITNNMQIAYSITQNTDSELALEYMAFLGQSERVYAIFKQIPREDWQSYTSKYILNQVVRGSIIKLRKLSEVQVDSAVASEKEFIDEIVELFIDSSITTGAFPKELFQTLLLWCDELVNLSFQEEALLHIRTALQMGSNKFPDLHLQFLSRMARIVRDKGKLIEAYSILVELVHGPYLGFDRNLIPGILFDLGQTALLTGNIDYYKKIIFKGLRYFYTNSNDRRMFVDQLCKTYRSFYRILLHKEVRMSDKILFLIHWVYYKIPDFSRLYMGILNKGMWYMLLGIVYGLHYFRNDQLLPIPEHTVVRDASITADGTNHLLPSTSDTIRKRRNILITRAMGGIGDLLMLTPGIHALHEKFPDEEVFLAIPNRYFQVFENNRDVTLIDIEKGSFDYMAFRKWYNFTDCPAARMESLAAPKVRKSRIDIFARALGIKGMGLRKMDRSPRYFLSEDEKALLESFWRKNDLKEKEVIGVQLYAGESYRDYPHMERLVRELSSERIVLVFDTQHISDFNFPNVIKIDTYNLRQVFAIASGCDVLVCPDSAFVHLAGALNIRCVALFGPIDGKLRTKHYPSVNYLDARARLGCVSCWRNEVVPCKLTNMRSSVCMGDIPVEQVVALVENKLSEMISEKG
jgi:ADP-heptose:LPS heptosyltransferase